MKTATAQELRDEFARVSDWVKKGETVRITLDGEGFALLVPDRTPKEAAAWPDLAARRRRVFPRGVRGRPLSKLVEEGRGAR